MLPQAGKNVLARQLDRQVMLFRNMLLNLTDKIIFIFGGDGLFALGTFQCYRHLPDSMRAHLDLVASYSS